MAKINIDPEQLRQFNSLLKEAEQRIKKMGEAADRMADIGDRIQQSLCLFGYLDPHTKQSLDYGRLLYDSAYRAVIVGKADDSESFIDDFNRWHRSTGMTVSEAISRTMQCLMANGPLPWE